MTETVKIPYKIYLTEDEMPRDWYNVRADMTKKPAPLLNPESWNRSADDGRGAWRRVLQGARRAGAG